MCRFVHHQDMCNVVAWKLAFKLRVANESATVSLFLLLYHVRLGAIQDLKQAQSVLSSKAYTALQLLALLIQQAIRKSPEQATQYAHEGQGGITRWAPALHQYYTCYPTFERALFHLYKLNSSFNRKRQRSTRCCVLVPRHRNKPTQETRVVVVVSLNLCTTETLSHLQQALGALAHARMHVRLGALDVVVDEPIESWQAPRGLLEPALAGNVSLKQNKRHVPARCIAIDPSAANSKQELGCNYTTRVAKLKERMTLQLNVNPQKICVRQQWNT